MIMNLGNDEMSSDRSTYSGTEKCKENFVQKQYRAPKSKTTLSKVLKE
jgi:hypothetical protein